MLHAVGDVDDDNDDGDGGGGCADDDSVIWVFCFILFVCLIVFWPVSTGKSSSYYWNIFGFFLLCSLC